MHASIEQLLNLQDASAARRGEAADRVHVDACPECQHELHRIEALRAELKSLPEVEPDGKSADATWATIVARYGQTRAKEEAGKDAQHWLPLSLAASLVLATLVAVFASWQRAETPVVASSAEPTRTVPATSELVERSQRLEQILGSLQYEPRVVNARTAGTIAQLEDQIAWIDYGLGEGGDGRLSETDANALWRQRVELMNSLVYVRYAQAQRVDF
ncbi:MAG: hypothetical protein HKN59_01700 [Gammaproteobacteria bacterium]|nr:hypothetical protein [Gammaproteobacteria bacterium]